MLCGGCIREHRDRAIFVSASVMRYAFARRHQGLFQVDKDRAKDYLKMQQIVFSKEVLPVFSFSRHIKRLSLCAPHRKAASIFTFNSCAIVVLQCLAFGF